MGVRGVEGGGGSRAHSLERRGGEGGTIAGVWGGSLQQYSLEKGGGRQICTRGFNSFCCLRYLWCGAPTLDVMLKDYDEALAAGGEGDDTAHP